MKESGNLADGGKLAEPFSEHLGSGVRPSALFLVRVAHEPALNKKGALGCRD